MLLVDRAKHRSGQRRDRQRHPRRHHGHRREDGRPIVRPDVDPAAIRDTALLAIEGERDDISGLGQTKAALDIATKLPEGKKRYYMAPEVGHYGIFNGRKWRETIAPVVEKFITANS